MTDFGFLNFEILVGHPSGNMSKELSSEEMVKSWTYELDAWIRGLREEYGKIWKGDGAKLWIQGCC